MGQKTFYNILGVKSGGEAKLDIYPGGPESRSRFRTTDSGFYTRSAVVLLITILKRSITVYFTRNKDKVT